VLQCHIANTFSPILPVDQTGAQTRSHFSVQWANQMSSYHHIPANAHSNPVPFSTANKWKMIARLRRALKHLKQQPLLGQPWVTPGLFLHNNRSSQSWLVRMYEYTVEKISISRQWQALPDEIVKPKISQYNSVTLCE